MISIGAYHILIENHIPINCDVLLGGMIFFFFFISRKKRKCEMHELYILPLYYHIISFDRTSYLEFCYIEIILQSDNVFKILKIYK